MSIYSSARYLLPTLDNPKLTIRRRSRADPTLLNDFEMAAEGNEDPPVPDLRTMKELCQPSLNRRGGPIAPITIQAMNFGLKNDMIQQDTSAQRSESSSSITSSSDTEIAALKAEMVKIKKNLMRVLQVNQQVKAVTPNCKTCGGPHSYIDCPATVGQTQMVYAAGAYQVVDRETKATKDTVHPTNNGSTKDVQPPVVQTESPIQNSKPVLAPIIEPIVALVRELSLRVGKESITFNVDQTYRYSANYNDMTANRIDVIDMAFGEYSDFLLEEVDAFLALKEDHTSSKVDQSYFDPEGYILFLEAFL
nr:reverse transcriptase domain-containing protein [Tanacetum cinerariifolium]